MDDEGLKASEELRRAQHDPAFSRLMRSRAWFKEICEQRDQDPCEVGWGALMLMLEQAYAKGDAGEVAFKERYRFVVGCARLMQRYVCHVLAKKGGEGVRDPRRPLDDDDQQAAAMIKRLRWDLTGNPRARPPVPRR